MTRRDRAIRAGADRKNVSAVWGDVSRPRRAQGPPSPLVSECLSQRRRSRQRQSAAQRAARAAECPGAVTPPPKNTTGKWSRQMTPDHLVTIRELTYHVGLSYPSRGHVARMVRVSGLTWHRRKFRQQQGPHTGKWIEWMAVPMETAMAFLLSRYDQLWQDAMTDLPPSAQRISPFLKYRGLLKRRSKRLAEPCSPWPYKASTSLSASWNKVKRMTTQLLPLPPSRRSTMRPSNGTSTRTGKKSVSA